MDTSSLWSDIAARLGLGETSLSLVIGGGAGLAVLATVMFVARFLYLCRPSEILIFSGRKHRLRRRHRGRLPRRVRRPRLAHPAASRPCSGWRCCAMPIDVSVAGRVLQGRHPAERARDRERDQGVDPIPPVVMNAIERFLGRGMGDIPQVAKETLEGHLRGVLATLTPEEVNEDRLKFADSSRAEVEQDLAKLGLHLDVLKIQHVTDDANYLESIGRERIASDPRRRDRRVQRAQRGGQGSGRRRDAGQGREADAEARSSRSRTSCAGSRPSSRARRKSAEERAEQAGPAARAEAEQELQKMRGELERSAWRPRSSSRPRSSARRPRWSRRAEAAPIAENGRASAESLRLVAEAWKAAGPRRPTCSCSRSSRRSRQRRRRRRRRSRSGRAARSTAATARRCRGFAAAYPRRWPTVLAVAGRDHRRRHHRAAHARGRRGNGAYRSPRGRGGALMSLLIALVVLVAVVFAVVCRWCSRASSTSARPTRC